MRIDVHHPFNRIEQTTDVPASRRWRRDAAVGLVERARLSGNTDPQVTGPGRASPVPAATF